MKRPTWRDHADLLLGGKLDEILRAWRHDGVTVDRIVRLLEDEYDIEASRETVRKWIKQAAA